MPLPPPAPDVSSAAAGRGYGTQGRRVCAPVLAGRDSVAESGAGGHVLRAGLAARRSSIVLARPRSSSLAGSRTSILELLMRMASDSTRTGAPASAYSTMRRGHGDDRASVGVPEWVDRRRSVEVAEDEVRPDAESHRDAGASRAGARSDRAGRWRRRRTGRRAGSPPRSASTTRPSSSARNAAPSTLNSAVDAEEVRQSIRSRAISPVTVQSSAYAVNGICIALSMPLDPGCPHRERWTGHLAWPMTSRQAGAAFRAPAVTRCSAPACRPSNRRRTVSSVSASRSVLVEPQAGDAREAQREAGLVAVRSEDDVERDLDDDRRLDDPVAAVVADRVLLEPAGHRRRSRRRSGRCRPCRS